MESENGRLVLCPTDLAQSKAVGNFRIRTRDPARNLMASKQHTNKSRIVCTVIVPYRISAHCAAPERRIVAMHTRTTALPSAHSTRSHVSLARLCQLEHLRQAPVALYATRVIQTPSSSLLAPPTPWYHSSPHSTFRPKGTTVADKRGPSGGLAEAGRRSGQP